MSSEGKEALPGDQAPAPAETHATPNGSDAPAAVAPSPVARPSGWMYKRAKIGGRKLDLWYASPKAQLLLVSFVCFLCPGMFNALNGLGGGGQLDGSANAAANTALYSTFAVIGFFAGTFTNKLGVKTIMAFGGLGYPIYAGSFLSFNHNQNRGFVIFAGAFLGICAGLLWCAQGTIMMSYPPENAKGRYISWFWVIFNFGAVIGALVPLGQNINSSAGGVNDGTYIGLMVLMICGAALALSLINADKVVREDGSHVIVMKNPTWQSELMGLWELLVGDPWILLLFPMFFASNVFYTYQLNVFNGAYFNIRTRSLNNVLYWLAQIFGAVIFGYGLDYPGLRRSMRAKISFGALFVITFVVWGGGWAFQSKQASRAEAAEEGHHKVDWTEGGEAYIGPMFLMIFYGFFDAIWQTAIYWYMGAMSNSGRKAANLAGFYKGIQSAGAAVYWGLDEAKISYNSLFGATWGLVAAGLVFAAPVIWVRIKDTVTMEEDLKFSDETAADVAPTAVSAEPTKAEV